MNQPQQALLDTLRASLADSLGTEPGQVPSTLLRDAEADCYQRAESTGTPVTDQIPVVAALIGKRAAAAERRRESARVRRANETPDFRAAISALTKAARSTEQIPQTLQDFQPEDAMEADVLKEDTTRLLAVAVTLADIDLGHDTVETRRRVRRNVRRVEPVPYAWSPHRRDIAERLAAAWDVPVADVMDKHSGFVTRVERVCDWAASRNGEPVEEALAGAVKSMTSLYRRPPSGERRNRQRPPLPPAWASLRAFSDHHRAYQDMKTAADRLTASTWTDAERNTLRGRRARVLVAVEAIRVQLTGESSVDWDDALASLLGGEL